MLIIKKDKGFRSLRPLPTGGPGFLEIPAGTSFVCVRGGKNPRLAFKSPVADEYFVMTLPASKLSECLEAVSQDSLPDALLSHLNLLPDQQIPRFSKGAVVSVVESFNVNEEVYGEGVLLKCVKGGSTPHFVVRRPSDKEVVTLCLTGAYLRNLRTTSPIVDDTFKGMKHTVTANDALSQETIALSGTIELQNGMLIAVECEGRGDPVSFYSMGHHGNQPEEKLGELLDTAVRNANLSPASFPEVGTLFANYLTQTIGIETFGEYCAHLLYQLNKVRERTGRAPLVNNA